MDGNRPLVGVISDRRMQGPHPFHMVGEKYLKAVADAAGGFPVGLPCLAEGFDVLDILDRLDGLFLTGSPSNVEPRHYLGDPSEPGTWHDPERDLAALALIPLSLFATTGTDPKLALWLFGPLIFCACISQAAAPTVIQIMVPNEMRAQISAVWMSIRPLV